MVRIRLPEVWARSRRVASNRGARRCGTANTRASKLQRERLDFRPAAMQVPATEEDGGPMANKQIFERRFHMTPRQKREERAIAPPSPVPPECAFSASFQRPSVHSAPSRCFVDSHHRWRLFLAVAHAGSSSEGWRALFGLQTTRAYTSTGKRDLTPWYMAACIGKPVLRDDMVFLPVSATGLDPNF